MSWRNCKLSDFASVYSGYAFKAKELSESEGIPLIKIKNVHDRIVDKDVMSFLPKDSFKPNYNKYVLKEGDILIAMTGQGSVGRIGKMMDVDDTYLVNQRVGIVRANTELVDKEFLYQLIANPSVESIYFNLAAGAGQPNLSPKDIGNLELMIPESIDTQKKIANILSAYDDLIENNLKRIKLLEEAAQNIYKEWFVNFRFPNHENTPIDDETGLPVGWEMKKVEDCIKIVKGKKPKQELEAETPNSVLYLLVDVIERREIRFAENDNLRITEAGETLMLMDGSRSGYVFRSLDGAIGSTLAVFRLTDTKVGRNYCFYYFKIRENEIRSKNTGAAIPHANKSYIYGMNFPVPDEKLMSHFEKTTSMFYNQVEVLHSQNKILKEARDILLPRLMNRTIEV